MQQAEFEAELTFDAEFLDALALSALLEALASLCEFALFVPVW